LWAVSELPVFFKMKIKGQQHLFGHGPGEGPITGWLGFPAIQ
jgi:hypothetical protein